MALLPIIIAPDPRLKIKTRAVGAVDTEVRQLMNDMLETMYAAPGIGLAATQVDVHQRILVLDASPDKSSPMHFVNPKIVETEGLSETEEGCLSVPGVFETIQRAERIVLTAFDGTGSALELEAEGLLAVCIKHEIDHLDGKLFIDYLAQLKQSRIRKKLEKDQRLAM